jgi:hypothetical protein
MDVEVKVSVDEDLIHYACMHPWIYEKDL